MPRTRTKLVQPATSPRNSPVTTRRILGLGDLIPLARTEAMRLAKGDSSRIDVLSPTEAVVRNTDVRAAKRGR